MSLTAHLLFGEPTRLPKGRIRTHNPDSNRRDSPTADQVEHAARNTQTYQSTCIHLPLKLL